MYPTRDLQQINSVLTSIFNNYKSYIVNYKKRTYIKYTKLKTKQKLNYGVLIIIKMYYLKNIFTFKKINF